MKYFTLALATCCLLVLSACTSSGSSQALTESIWVLTELNASPPLPDTTITAQFFEDGTMYTILRWCATPFCGRLNSWAGGEGGIRTPGTVSPYTRFPGEHVDGGHPARRPAGRSTVQNRSRRFCKPLSHLSEPLYSDASICGGNSRHGEPSGRSGRGFASGTGISR